ncbi:MAG: UDP-glucose/GDP-mannose dehydrogenase family protein [bacterium]
MKVTVVGTGYVGLVLGPCLASFGNQVVCVDIDKEKIEKLKKGKVPIYEPGLTELIVEEAKKGTLSFSTSLKDELAESEIVFIAVGTPSNPDGTANLKYVYQVAEDIGKNLKGYKIIATKSTVPVGTGQEIKKIIKKHYKGEFDVVSCPEFLREGSAVQDFFEPNRIVIGAESKKAKDKIKKLFDPIDADIITTNIASSEMIKYASNAFLATKISFINEIANICEKVGADVDMVAHGMGRDDRIGRHFLHAGIGYGGSCFPKDVNALYQIAGTRGYEFNLLKAVITVNNNQRRVLFEKIKDEFKEIKGLKFGALGLAFKANTDDIRESASLEIIKLLKEAGAKVAAYDPIAEETAASALNGHEVEYTNDAYEAVKDADAVIIATEWPEFKDLDWNKIKSMLKKPYIFDGRNLLDKEKMINMGYKYFGIGK